MRDYFNIVLHSRLFTMLALVIVGTFVSASTPAAFAVPVETPTDVQVDQQVQADADPCEEPCPGESDDGECPDDCQSCGCCSVVVSAALSCTSVAPAAAKIDPRGDLPILSSADPPGVILRIFKPPQPWRLSA